MHMVYFFYVGSEFCFRITFREQKGAREEKGKGQGRRK